MKTVPGPCPKMRTTMTALASALTLLVLAAPPLLAADAARPNIILIMSDDMGCSDLGCYGGEISTPNLDALAQDGLRFTQFYNTARCCPTRAALLTGLYPHQAGIGHMMEDKGLDGYRGDLNRQCVTIAEVLKPAGYRTYMAGKWHVTQDDPARRRRGQHNWPLQRGFDRFYGTIHGGGQLLRSHHARPRQHVHLALRRSGVSAGAVLLHRRHQRPRRALHRRARTRPRRQAVLPVRGLHRGALADARQGGRHRQVQGQVRRRLRRHPRRARGEDRSSSA